MIAKIKIATLIILFFITNLTFGQVKFRVKKLNADSLTTIISKKDGSDKIEALNLLSNIICRQNIDSSILLASQAIELSEHLEYQKGLADGYFNTGNVYFLLNSLQPTISNYLKALRIYEDLEPTEEFGNLCMQLGLLNYFSGRLEVSLHYFGQAQNIYYKINDKVGQAMAINGIGVMKDILHNDLDSAIYYYNKALSLLDPTFDQNEVAYLYQEIGVNYNKQFHKFNDTLYFNKALSYFFKALGLSEINAGTKGSILYYLGQAYLFSNTNESESKGIKYLQEANNIYDTCSESYKYDFGISNHLGLICYRKGEYKKAITHYKQGIKIIDERLSTFSIEKFQEPVLAYNLKYFLNLFKQSIYENMYYAYKKLNDYKLAHEYYTLNKDAEEEIYMEKNQNLITLLESISEDEKTEKQMTILERDNELNKMKVAQSRIYVIAMGGVVLILALLTVLFVRQRKTRQIFREQKLLHDLELKNMESEKLKELDHLKSRFFANISHEFRTPLTLIKGPLEKAISQSENEKQIKELGIAKKYTGRLQVLINNLLTISKLESGKMQLSASEVNILELVKNYMQAFESLAKQKNIDLKFISENKEIKAFIDREKLEQALNNLLSNAFKFTEEGGKINVEVTPLNPPPRFREASAEQRRGEIHPQDRKGVEIKISDTGRGISPDHLPHIFDRFYQAGQENNSYYEGTGIGLALTKELVELHHGKIIVESEQGKGSIFTILLPLGKDHIKPEEIAVDKPDEISSPSFSPGVPDRSMENTTDKDITIEIDDSKPVLLIVEDNTDMRSYIRGYFENEYRIIEAVDGTDGYEKSTEHIPDIIISDVMMPKMDGNEFCKKVKTDERSSHIPVILLTARASSESKIEGLEKGADDFLTKPFDGEELKVRVKNIIDQRERLSKVLKKKFQKSQSSISIDFEDSGITSMDEELLNRIIKSLKAHHSNPEFNIEHFCQVIGLSRIHLHRKIKALTGQSTGEFIRTYRLNHAAELLKKHSSTVAEIAYDVGFSSPSYFSKCFQKQFGCLPSEFAHQN